MMANTKRRCLFCREYFLADEGMKTPVGWFHDELCAMQYARRKHLRAVEKRKRERHKQAKERLKTRSDWLREAQAAFNKFIRLRDEADPCICCGRDHQGQYHAGHYLSVGAHPELRFEEDNVHKQASYCNNHKSGNQAQYRIRLIEKIGQDRVEWLEGPHDAKNWTVEDIKAIRDTYRKKARELEKEYAGA